MVHINTVRPYTCRVFEHPSTLTDSHETVEALGRVMFLERPSTLGHSRKRLEALGLVS
jgi:hypothetical protein